MARLGDVCDILNGFAFKSEQYVEEGIRIIRIANVQKGYIEDSTPVFYPYNSREAQKYRLEEGDMLMSLTGNVGRVAELSKEFLPAALNQRVACLRIKDGVSLSKAFLFNLLDSDYFEQQCIAASKGVAQKNMSTEWLREYEIPLFPLEQQKAIASILDKISELISLRKEQLAKLDQLVKARFVEMFGEMKSISEPLKVFLEDITYGFTNPMPDAEEGPWKVTAKDVINGKINYDTARKTTVEAFEELTAKSKPAVGDVLLTKDGTLGRCAVVEEDEICVNQSVAVLKCNNKILPKFLAILLQMPEYQREMLKNAGGGTIKHIYITKIVDMQIMVPTIPQQIEFLSFVEQSEKLKTTIQQSLDKLEVMKKAMMQEYFGQ